MLRVSWNPGRHSQEMPPFCVSLQMCAQPWFLSMQVGPSFAPSGCTVKEAARPGEWVYLFTATKFTQVFFLKPKTIQWTKSWVLNYIWNCSNACHAFWPSVIYMPAAGDWHAQYPFTKIQALVGTCSPVSGYKRWLPTERIKLPAGADPVDL